MGNAAPIEEYIKELLPLNGNKAHNPIDIKPMRAMYKAKSYEKLALAIRDSLRLELPIEIEFVDVGNAPLWVQVPKPFPAYGTRRFRQTTVFIKIKKEFVEQRPFEWLVAGLAHELCHIVLLSVSHPLQDVEPAVDLLAMIMGYQDFICKAQGREEVGTMWWILTAALLPFGILFRRRGRLERLGYLSEGDAYYARVLLDRHRRLTSEPPRFHGRG